MPIILRVAGLLLRTFARALLIGLPAFAIYEFSLLKEIYAEKLRGFRLEALRNDSPAGDPAGSRMKAFIATGEFFLHQAGHAFKLSVTHPAQIGPDFAKAIGNEIAKGLNYNPIDNAYIQKSIAREFGKPHAPKISTSPKPVPSPTAQPAITLPPQPTITHALANGEPSLENMPGVGPVRRNPMPRRPGVTFAP